MFVKQTNNLEALSEWPFHFQKNGAFFLMKMATYLLQFMQKQQIVEENGKSVDYFIGVSGGADSMALLSLLWAIRKLRPEFFQSLTIIHINHGTRRECQEEQDFVERTALQLGVKFKAHKLSLSLNQGNFEMGARQERYKIFRSYLHGHQGKHWFYLAHQLDDSFEWSLLQGLKSSNPRSTLGIPLVNGAFARPLLCLSRQQLLRLALAIGLPYKQDASNTNAKFERGYLRQRIIPSIQERYPQYLANYVARANQWAHFFKVHRLTSKSMTVVQSQLLNDGFGGQLLVFVEEEGKTDRIEDVLRQTIERLSGRGRGRLRNQISRLKEAYGHHKIGPIYFSGGVLAYLLPGLIHLVLKQNLPQYHAFDQLLASSLAQKRIPLVLDPSQLSLPSTLSCAHLLPLPVRVKSRRKGHSAQFGVHPLFHQSCAVLREDLWKIRKVKENDQQLLSGLCSLSFVLTREAVDVLHSRLQALSTTTILELSPNEF
ncbi:MAG: tRNA lysidine(34) synthetase TilS [Bdellovibrio sp.]|nr:tRNA lysidine(34) synthetase TilS [Bdellovibrio sp.]